MTPRPRNYLADLLAAIRLAGLPEPVEEHPFLPPGMTGTPFRFDLAWPLLKICFECEGGVYVGGRHVRGAGYERDCFKYSTAAIEGWLVIRMTPGQIDNGQALNFIQRALEVRKK